MFLNDMTSRHFSLGQIVHISVDFHFNIVKNVGEKTLHLCSASGYKISSSHQRANRCASGRICRNAR